MPPDPIVRKDDDELVAIDGHNLLAVMSYFGREINVHVANDKTDGLPNDSEANEIRNQDLHDKFDSCLDARDVSKNGGVTSFSDLVKKYPELFGEQ